MGVVNQSTINEHGVIVPKSRGTHDRTFQPTHGKSMNDRIFSGKLVMVLLCQNCVVLMTKHSNLHIVNP